MTPTKAEAPVRCTCPCGCRVVIRKVYGEEDEPRCFACRHDVPVGIKAERQGEGKRG
jgi:hypothetical protein